MNAALVARTPTSFTLQVQVPYSDSMLHFEETLQERLNEAGVLATAEGLQQFDTDGSPLAVGPVQLTSKGLVEKDYQTPYGVATVARHVSQSPPGGKTSCPLDRGARIVVSSTPRFAKVVAHKSAQFRFSRVEEDLRQNQGRTLCRGLIQDIAEPVAAVALAKQEDWSDNLPKWEAPPATVAIGLDGTCLLMCEDGWRETMVGTLSLYERGGEWLHTIDLAATPEYGKATFLGRLEGEIARVKAKHPEARYVGIAHGAKGNWEFLGRHTEVVVVDFWHAAEDLGKAAVVLHRGRPKARQVWLDDACHRLKHEPGGAEWVLKQLRSLARTRPWAKDDEDVQRAVTSFANQSATGRMDDAARVAANEPIGSGVTEAACQVIVKQRLCGSGMKWKEDGAAVVLSLRCLS